MKQVLTVVTLVFSSVIWANSSINKAGDVAPQSSSLENNLRVLSDEIGGRLPGTPALKRAVDWSVQAFKEAGATKVWLEPFTIKVAWQEGDTQIRVVAPEQFKVRAVSFGWSPALISKKAAPVIDIGMGSAEDFKRAGDLRGAVLLLHAKPMNSWIDLFAEYLDLPPVVERAVAAKAQALALISNRPRGLLYRHMNAAPNQIDVLPMFIVSSEDGLRMARLLAKKQKLMMDIQMPNKIGPAFTAWNVIAEIKGSERPNEWVLLGAHLDSWDLGTGALDNGANVALIIDSFRAIKALGIRPKRSLRFVLFTGEEQGFIGSHAYVLAHHQEMDKAAGVVIIDGGVGAITGYSLNGREDLLAKSQQILAPLNALGVQGNTVDAEVGTDNLSFLLEGVPNLVANQKEANYLVNYHAQSDSFDKVDLKQLRKNVRITTATILALADAAEPIGKRLTILELEALIKKTQLDRQMKLFGVWDYWSEIKAKRH